MEKITEKLGIIPWLVNSNLHKKDVIVSYIGPTALKLSKKKFRKRMEEKSNALVSRAKREVRSYKKVAEADQHKIYPKLTKLGKKLRKICLKLQRAHKLVKRLLINQPRPSQAMMLRLTKTSLVVKRRAERILLKADIMIDVMVDYIKKFRFYVKGLARDVKNKPKMNSVFLSLDIFNRKYLEGEVDPKLVATVATEADLIAAKRFNTLGRCNISLQFADTLDQNSAALLVKSALEAKFPAENLIIPEAVRVRVADDGSVEMY